DPLCDEDDRQRVRERPDEEGELPPGVALDEAGGSAQGAGEADQLVPEGCCCPSHANTPLSASTSSLSCPNSRPVAAKNASSSVSERNRALSSSTGSRQSRRPPVRIPTRSASASASARSCVQSRIVASWAAQTSRMKSCTSSFERGSRPVGGSSRGGGTGEGGS